MIGASIKLLSRVFMWWSSTMPERRPRTERDQVEIYRYNTNYPFF